MSSTSLKAKQTHAMTAAAKPVPHITWSITVRVFVQHLQDCRHVREWEPRLPKNSDAATYKVELGCLRERKQRSNKWLGRSDINQHDTF